MLAEGQSEANIPLTANANAGLGKSKYGVKFPMFAKTHVSGDNPNPLYAELIKATGTKPKWNFYKYLIDRKGKVIESYSSLTTPDNSQLQADIKRALAQK